MVSDYNLEELSYISQASGSWFKMGQSHALHQESMSQTENKGSESVEIRLFCPERGRGCFFSCYKTFEHPVNPILFKVVKADFWACN